MSGTTEYTAGPWECDGEEIAPRTGSLLAVYIAKDGDGRVAKVFANCLVTTDAECRANALLIAAAPDMLDALMALVGEWPDGLGPRLGERVAMARAAIAKALGDGAVPPSSPRSAQDE